MCEKDISCIYIDIKGSTTSKILLKNGSLVLEPYINSNRFAYKIRYLLHMFHLDRWNIFFRINNNLLHYNVKTFVVMGSLIYEPFLRQLRDAFPYAIIKFCYPNIVNCGASLKPAVLRKYGVKGYSWDINDCNIYGLNYHTPFFDSTILPYNNSLKYDVCFIGSDKGRYKSIMKLNMYFAKNNIKAYIRIIPNLFFLKFFRRHYSKSLPYHEYLQIVANSKCIIDFVQKRQVGTTTRTMEAVFSNKKLISNNQCLKNYDFYNPCNILILNGENTDQIFPFLSSDYVPVPQNILYTYTFQSWEDTLLKE